MSDLPLTSEDPAARDPLSLLVVTPSAYPLGGVATWLAGLTPALRGAGWRVTLGLLAGRHHDARRYLEAHPDPEPVEIANPGGSREGRVAALATAIRETRPDVVLSVNVADVELAFDRLRRNGSTRARLAVTQHAIHPDFFVHLRDRKAAVDGVICTNRLTAELARAFSGVSAERVHYAPYGVALPALARGPRPDGPLRIAWAGRFDEAQKRVLDLPAICGGLDRLGVEFHLAIAGAGPQEPELRERLAPWTGSGRVELVGALASEDMAHEIYGAADVLLITSSWETGPIVAWEAMAQGVAVVTSSFLGIGREGALVDGDTAWLFPVGDGAAAARALAAARAPRARERVSSRGRELVAARYSLGVSTAAWRNALETIAAGPPLPAGSFERESRPSGRLERLFGPRLGAAVRRSVGRRNPQAAPGDEWPHGYGRGEAPEFYELARELDAATVSTRPEASTS